MYCISLQIVDLGRAQQSLRNEIETFEHLTADLKEEMYINEEQNKRTVSDYLVQIQHLTELQKTLECALEDVNGDVGNLLNKVSILQNTLLQTEDFLRQEEVRRCDVQRKLCSVVSSVRQCTMIQTSPSKDISRPT